MKMKECIFALCVTTTLLTGCHSDIEINKSQRSQASELVNTDNNSQSKTEINITSESPPKNNSPHLGERFFAYPLITTGELYVTVTSAEYFTNINDAEINTDNFRSIILEWENDTKLRYFDAETGEILPEEATDTPRVLVVVHLVVENVNAISFWQETEKGLRGINPIFKDGYCNKYDFSADDFGIGVLKHNNAYDTQSTTGTGVDYFSLSKQLYNDEYRYFMYHLEPGESVSFDIGKFMPLKISDNDSKETFGGEIGENLISRYCVVTSSNPLNPIIELNLN